MISSWFNLHPNSLVHPSVHCPALVKLVESDVTNTLVECLVNTVVEVVDYVLDDAPPLVPQTSSRTCFLEFLKFANGVIRRAQVTTPVILVSIVYINRVKPRMQIALEQWAYERVLLGALVVANKYLNDVAMKNVHWALCTHTFGKGDVGVMEREFLDVLDFELSISEADLLAQHSVLSELSSLRAPVGPCAEECRETCAGNHALNTPQHSVIFEEPQTSSETSSESSELSSTNGSVRANHRASQASAAQTRLRNAEGP